MEKKSSSISDQNWRSLGGLSLLKEENSVLKIALVD